MTSCDLRRTTGPRPSAEGLRSQGPYALQLWTTFGSKAIKHFDVIIQGLGDVKRERDIDKFLQPQQPLLQVVHPHSSVTTRLYYYFI